MRRKHKEQEPGNTSDEDDQELYLVLTLRERNISAGLLSREEGNEFHEVCCCPLPFKATSDPFDEAAKSFSRFSLEMVVVVGTTASTGLGVGSMNQTKAFPMYKEGSSTRRRNRMAKAMEIPKV